ncbi:HEAT repeat-containing protein [Heterostelium album PN500]|uniref:HEAT repeat-containing protein n=1 Tax=Heterostelium pallidum (strain ATCC 26659 / Pp 5 / PN500) TaxID=670386 RepID=D3B6G3_HETP5|nr:HEAT repeat-containing protein [Heterostelium album PN500]EFA82933.1 HEAT repeat-containing protein [Heterostelium album PN500]|eukprot:XP_020435050.1 HEAT repeat-containing protein [Heterostelium album PN500]
MTTFFLSQILEKMNSRDKDIRFMATHDLANELEKDSFKMDPLQEPKIVAKLLTLTDDNANNVQENVVKCLGLLVRIVKDTVATEMAEHLCKDLLTSTKEELQEISSIGLKTIVANMPADTSAVPSMVTKKIIPKLLEGIEKSKPGDKTEVKMYCLDILNDFLSKYGPLVPHLDKIEEAKKADHISTLIQLIGSIGKTSGYRLGKYLPKIMPHIINYCDSNKFENNDEIKENCLLCFESIIERCQKDVTPYLNDIITLSLKYIKFDPNYSDEDEEEEDVDEMETDEDEEEEEDEDADISDDDDISWKIRRSAAKVLCAIITYRTELLNQLIERVAPVLYSRFKEREENVRLDIFNTFVLLLKQCQKRNIDGLYINTLKSQVAKLVSSIKKPLSDKSIRTRVGAFILLRELVGIVPGILSDHVNVLIPGITGSLSDKNNNSNLKIETLSFLRLLFANHPHQIFFTHAKNLSVLIIKCIKEPYYRVCSEALKVCQEFSNVLRSDANTSVEQVVSPLYEAALVQLKAQDIDQEVKENAISCVGTIVANFGDKLQAQLSPCFAILLERLDNELTRVITIKALSKIITSPVRVDVTPLVSKSIELLSSFLRKNNRPLKQNTITLLNDIVINTPNVINEKQLPTILTELSSNINESDLQLTHLSFVFYQNLLKSYPQSASLIREKLIPPTLLLLKSSLLQGVALESLLSLFATIVKLNQPGVTCSDLLNILFETAGQIKQPVTRQSFNSIAQCIAIVTVNADAAHRDQTVQRLMKNLTTDQDSLILLSLTCIGEIGRRVDLGAFKTIHIDIFKIFDATNEELKQVAALSLGNIAVSSLAVDLPFILENIKQQPKKQYLLLHSLRECITKLPASSTGIQAIVPFLPQIVPLLFENSVNEEEGTRNLVAECLGKLSIVAPADIIPQLRAKIDSPSALERSTSVTSIKFAILENREIVDTHLAPHIDQFLSLLNDNDLIVKRSALLTLNYIAHNRPKLILSSLNNYLPILYNNSKIKPELIREVSLGPFKHKVDDGIEIRKTAFECMYTLLETTSAFDFSPFIESLAGGLKDTQHDIKLLCHLLIIRLAAVNGQALLEGLVQLVEPLKATLLAKVTDVAVKQQVERNEECIRSALRVIAAIHRIPSSESIVKFEELIRTTIRGSPTLAAQFKTISEEDQLNQDSMDTSEKLKKLKKKTIVSILKKNTKQ